MKPSIILLGVASCSVCAFTPIVPSKIGNWQPPTTCSSSTTGAAPSAHVAELLHYCSTTDRGQRATEGQRARVETLLREIAEIECCESTLDGEWSLCYATEARIDPVLTKNAHPATAGLPCPALALS